jgi:fructose-1,6-bisphosphatase/inositol monophosphatase family enzyme
MRQPTASEFLETFARAAAAAHEAVRQLDPERRRARTERPGQYALDVVADLAAIEVLRDLEVAILSEESGWSGADSTAITVVLDPIDGSTNCAHGIGYFATSIAAMDADGALCGYVVNHATGHEYRATRGEGATADGAPAAPSGVTRIEDAIVALSGMPSRLLPWAQFRALGCASLALCDVGAGALDGYVDGGAWHAPWDYLAGMLFCREAGGVVVEALGQPLEVTDTSARRALLAAATPDLLDALRPAGARS